MIIIIKLIKKSEGEEREDDARTPGRDCGTNTSLILFGKT